HSHPHHRDLHSFPTRRSSDLGHAPDIDLRSQRKMTDVLLLHVRSHQSMDSFHGGLPTGREGPARDDPTSYRPGRANAIERMHWIDRKSTRLNSSHSQISYAVF